MESDVFFYYKILYYDSIQLYILKRDLILGLFFVKTIFCLYVLSSFDYIIYRIYLKLQTICAKEIKKITNSVNLFS